MGLGLVKRKVERWLVRGVCHNLCLVLVPKCSTMSSPVCESLLVAVLDLALSKLVEILTNRAEKEGIAKYWECVYGLLHKEEVRTKVVCSGG